MLQWGLWLVNMEWFGLCVLIGHGSFVFGGSFVSYCVSYFTVGVPSVCMDFMDCYLMIGPVDLVYYDNCN